MERLTKKAVGCFRYDLKDHKHINGEFGDYDAFFDYNMAVKRLGEYEDTGLEPEDVNEFVNSYKTMRGNEEARVRLMCGTGVIHPERAAEITKAESEGRLLVLPCKVGDTLYEIDLPEYGVIVCKVMWMILKNDVSVQVEVIDGHGLGSGYCFELSDFGENVFRTREEAEAALKERENDG